MFNINIDENALISAGMNLSKNFILAHTSTGAYHYILGKITPTFTSILRPGVSPIPTWQIARNLQMGAQGIIENLLSEFGNDLILRSGFQGLRIDGSNLIQAFGQSFDVQIRGYENNMFNVAKTIQNLSKRAASIELVYGNSSFMKLNFNERSIMSNITNNVLPQLTTNDLLGNIIEAGLTSIRGR